MTSFSVFRHWLMESRAGVGPINLTAEGVFARLPIIKGDLVASVPRDLVVTETMARQSPAGKPLADAGVSQSEAFFATFLLRERSRGDSFWGPYIGQLPASFTDMPHYHGPHLMPMLAGTRALQIIRHNVQWARAAHQVVTRTVDAFKDLPLDDYLWGYFAACSRVFSAHVSGAKVSILAPLIDAFHVAIEPNAMWQCDVESGDCSVTALRDISPNEEIRVSYGGKSNTALFTRYGFTLLNNPVKEALLGLNASGDDAQALRVRNSFDDFEAPRMLATLRGHGNDKPVDLDAERDVLTRVRQAAISQLPAISAHAPPPPEVVALADDVARVCADERLALDWWIKLTNKMLPALNLAGEVRMSALSRLAEQLPEYQPYCRQLLEVRG